MLSSFTAPRQPFWRTLSTLPREARDTLFLLAVIAWVLLPQVTQLPVWCSLMAAGVLVWRGTLALQARPLPGRWWLVSLLAVTVAATLFTHRTILGREAGVTLIVVLLALKTLELRAKRDAFVVFFLGFFTMLTNFLSSQSLTTAVAMLVGLMGLLTALVNAHMPVGKPPLREAARTAGHMVLLGTPIMAVLFLLFPRIAPLWGVSGESPTGRSGLSDNMQVGTVASLALDDSIALRVRFESPVPPSSSLYFRGPVLTHFDGREWRPSAAFSPRNGHTTAGLQTEGLPVRYQVTLEPNQRPWVMVLDATPQSPDLPGYDLGMTPDLQWLSRTAFGELVRYTAQSFPRFRYGPLQASAVPADAIELPAGYNPRTLALAGQIRDQVQAKVLATPQVEDAPAKVDASQFSNAVLDLLRTGGYTYTLDPGVYGRDTADEFWFDRKEGFCEHIAAAYVVLMRAIGIPARIVTGYQGGEVNSVDGYWVVRQSDAHAWAEIWQAGKGWMRVDPTGSVAPGRIGSLTRLIPQRGMVATALGTLSPTLAATLRAGWDAVNNGWNQWVLNYSKAKQLNLLKNIGFTAPSWEDLGYLLSGLLVLASSAGALWTLWERRQHDPWLRLLDGVRTRAGKLGLDLPAHSPPRQMAVALQQHFGDEAQALADWLLRLERLRYAPPTSPADSMHSLRRQLLTLAWPKPRPTA